MDALDVIDQVSVIGKNGRRFMPPRVFSMPGSVHYPVFATQRRQNGVLDCEVRPARHMINQLCLHIYYAEGVDKIECQRWSAWIKYNLPARENPSQFAIRRIHGDPCLQEIAAWENLGKK